MIAITYTLINDHTSFLFHCNVITCRNVLYFWRGQQHPLTANWTKYPFQWSLCEVLCVGVRGGDIIRERVRIPWRPQLRGDVSASKKTRKRERERWEATGLRCTSRVKMRLRNWRRAPQEPLHRGANSRRVWEEKEEEWRGLIYMTFWWDFTSDICAFCDFRRTTRNQVHGLTGKHSFFSALLWACNYYNVSALLTFY